MTGNIEVVICPKCKQPMWCLASVTMAAVWICDEHYPHISVGVDEGDERGDWTAGGNVCVGWNSAQETIVIEPHDWQNPEGD